MLRYTCKQWLDLYFFGDEIELGNCKNVFVTIFAVSQHIFLLHINIFFSVAFPDEHNVISWLERYSVPPPASLLLFPVLFYHFNFVPTFLYLTPCSFFSTYCYRRFILAGLIFCRSTTLTLFLNSQTLSQIPLFTSNNWPFYFLFIAKSKYIVL